jgi:hypothetical protein
MFVFLVLVLVVATIRFLVVAIAGAIIGFADCSERYVTVGVYLTTGYHGSDIIV